MFRESEDGRPEMKVLEHGKEELDMRIESVWDRVGAEKSNFYV